MADMERATKGNIMILLVILGILAILLIIGTGRLAENGYFKLSHPPINTTPVYVPFVKEQRRPKNGRLHKAKIVRRKR